jgi:hypothetical protein
MRRRKNSGVDDTTIRGEKMINVQVLSEDGCCAVVCGVWWCVVVWWNNGTIHHPWQAMWTRPAAFLGKIRRLH